ncbi:HEAT repeat domain-containing protein [Spirulina sp. 06S082]|uniref:HEAT repeat domain-containing protein n=1 Tax=Spirulina sp. 06S082 TaxID=3110248 RepID=UPI002B20F706|nr:HEAT repeat domain-containing protein [Spirulina sp. 06S082]MEA5468119.1 HEAT repeat domain-containing protein [Spirulina sp. 06S082]
MDIVIGLLMGFSISAIVGTGVRRTALEKQSRGEEIRLEKLRQELNNVHELQLQQTIQSLKTDYLQQSEAKEIELKQNYQRQLAEAIAAQQQEAQQAIAAQQQETQQAIAAQKQETQQAIAAQKQETQRAIEQLENKHTQELAVLKAKIIAAFASQPSEKIKVEPVQKGVSGSQTADLPQLFNSIYDPDPVIRQQAVLAIGNIAAEKKVRKEIERAIPVLGKLSQDTEPSVRLAAVTALAQVNSQEVVTYLQRTLNDADSTVMQAASEAIAKFKRYAPKVAKPAPPNAAAKSQLLQ